MKMTSKLNRALLAALALMPMVVQAETLLLHFEAQAAATGLLQGFIAYSTDPADSVPGTLGGEGPGYANYSFTGTAFHYTASWVGGGVATSAYSLEVFDQGSLLAPADFPTDTLVFGTKLADVGYLLVLTGNNGSFAGHDLPSSAELLSPWTTARFVIRDAGAGSNVVAQVTALAVSAVPEPGAGWIWAVGLGVLACLPAASTADAKARRKQGGGARG